MLHTWLSPKSSTLPIPTRMPRPGSSGTASVDDFKYHLTSTGSKTPYPSYIYFFSQGTYVSYFNQEKIHSKTKCRAIHLLHGKNSCSCGGPRIPIQQSGIHRFSSGLRYCGIQDRRSSTLNSLAPPNIHPTHP